ncbi:MAG: glucose 1-dehydrogenase [Chloroflexaceae bacterium]|jgi:NAD(P)-dependent dehydrogenase (short-subunit alcohol dehydrogenase family)|nr:glucose 1-dehydrogenase [Chloroflexaceae bacterium]
MQRLTGKRTIVTGAGSGIGRAIAQRFAAEGAYVVVADLDAAAAAQVATELGSACFGLQVDVRSAAAVENLVAQALERWGGLDVLVNNAGVGVAATIPNTSEADYERLMDINVRGTFLGMKYAIPAIAAAGGGAVINMASIAALVGIPDRGVYCAAKGAIMAMTKAAALDHVADGVRINCIAPGTVDTPWVARITAGYADPAAARAAMQARQPHGRFVQPEEIAAMAAYLASDEAASVIGAVMVVDGGMTAR